LSSLAPSFRLGLIGAGRMGRTHLRALSASSTVRIVAIAEPSGAARSSLHNVALYPDVSDMLDAGGLDGVLVAAPSPLHLALVTEIAQANLPILCEKPCGITADQAREAASIAEAHNTKLQIAYWRRFVPTLQHLRQRIADGAFGDLYCINCYQWDGEPPSAQFQASSGGIFIDMGVHEFDQIRWLSGQDILHLSATIGTGEESAQALATLSEGSSALISLGRRYPLGDICRVEVYGSRDADDCRFLWPPDGDAIFLDALRRQAEAFALWVRGGASTGATPQDAIAALAAAEQVA
jgi:myo-inositol 2-dehydrogenase/D-chiro-inositol 1-dehydrogenase